jgi:hypothetical protein
MICATDRMPPERIHLSLCRREMWRLGVGEGPLPTVQRPRRPFNPNGDVPVVEDGTR